MATYIMNCGCTLTEEELLLNGYKKSCPNHPKQGIKTVIKKCLDCPEILHLTPKQSTVLRCAECARKLNVIRCAEYRRSKNTVKTSATKPKKVMDISLYTQGLSRYLPRKLKKAS